MVILQDRCISCFFLRKMIVCLITLVTVLAICLCVLYTPILREEIFLGGLRGPFQSTCSLAADRRGPHQKIISYSLYGNFLREDHIRKYIVPFGDTLKSIPLIYPGWTVRIYHNLQYDDLENWKIFNRHLEAGSHVDFCNVQEVIENRNLEMNLSSTTWRWLTMIDEMVDTVMSRDSDSRIIHREEEAVREWLASDKIFHIMRDHPYHCQNILAGMWGVKLSQDRVFIAGVFQKIFTMIHNHSYGYDQDLLRDYIWPFAQLNMVSQDSYCCGKFPFSKPFPTPRKDGLFIGGRDDPRESLVFPCPVECRPVNATSEWDYC